jgi:hypothetical protein
MCLMMQEGEELRWRQRKSRLRVTHLDPSLVSHVHSMVTRLAAAIDLMSLARRSKVLRAVDSGSLPVLHLDDRGSRESS